MIRLRRVNIFGVLMLCFLAALGGRGKRQSTSRLRIAGSEIMR